MFVDGYLRWFLGSNLQSNRDEFTVALEIESQQVATGNRVGDVGFRTGWRGQRNVLMLINEDGPQSAGRFDDDNDPFGGLQVGWTVEVALVPHQEGRSPGELAEFDTMWQIETRFGSD